MPVLGPRGGPGPRRRTRSTADANMRVSDAERAEVADRLAQHYGDGRLDQAELDERLSRAMSAKTQADLDGLCDDLPEPGEPARPPRAARPPARPATARPRHRFLPVVLVILFVAVLWNPLHHWWFPWGLFGFWFQPWLWIAVIAVCWLIWGPWRRRG